MEGNCNSNKAAIAWNLQLRRNIPGGGGGGEDRNG